MRAVHACHTNYACDHMSSLMQHMSGLIAAVNLLLICLLSSSWLASKHVNSPFVITICCQPQSGFLLLTTSKPTLISMAAALCTTCLQHLCCCNSALSHSGSMPCSFRHSLVSWFGKIAVLEVMNYHCHRFVIAMQGPGVAAC